MHQALAKERSHQMGLESLGPGAKRLILATLQDILKIRNDPLLYSQIVAVCLGKKSSLLERFVCKPVWEMSLFRYLFLGWGMGWANSNCVLLWLFVGSAHTFLLASRPRHGVGITFEEFQVKQSVKTQALKFLYLESEKKSHDQNSQIPKNPWIYPLEIFHTLPTGGATDCQLVLPKHQWPCRIGTNWWWWALGSLGATRHINIATNQTHLGMGIYVTRGPGWLPRQSAARSFLSNRLWHSKLSECLGPPVEPKPGLLREDWEDVEFCVYQNTLFMAVFFVVWSKSRWISGIHCIHTSEDLRFTFCNSAKWQEIRRLLWCDIWRLSPRSASSVSGRSSWAPHVFPFERCGWPLPSGRMA